MFLPELLCKDAGVTALEIRIIQLWIIFLVYFRPRTGRVHTPCVTVHPLVCQKVQRGGAVGLDGRVVPLLVGIVRPLINCRAGSTRPLLVHRRLEPRTTTSYRDGRGGREGGREERGRRGGEEEKREGGRKGRIEGGREEGRKGGRKEGAAQEVLNEK